MTLRHRLTLVLPMALLMAAAVARAELGADTEASVLFTPAFPRALPIAAVAAWLVAPWFGRPGWAGWLRAAGVSLLVLIVAALAAALILPVPRPDAGPFALLLPMTAYPLAWGSAVFGFAAAQLLALRQRGRERHPDQPRP